MIVTIGFSCKSLKGKYCYHNDGCCGQCFEFIDSKFVEWSSYTDYSGIDRLRGRYEYKKKKGFIYGIKSLSGKSGTEVIFLDSKNDKDSIEIIIEANPINKNNDSHIIAYRFVNKYGKIIKIDGGFVFNKKMNPYNINISRKEFPITISTELEYHWKEYVRIDKAKSQRIIFHLEEATYQFGQSDTIRFTLEENTLKMVELNSRTRYLFSEKMIKEKKK